MTDAPVPPLGGGPGWRAVITRPLSPAQRKQIQLQLALMPVYAWLLFAWSAYAMDISATGRLDRSGHIKGHDFAHFYVLGQIALDGTPSELYSYADQSMRMNRLVPHYEDRFLPVYGPQVSLLFAPFARMPYERAVAAWLVLSALIYGACCYALWAAYPSLRRFWWEALILSAAYPPFYALVTSGHTSALALACFTGAFFALRANRPWVAGLALGSLVYKPALGLALSFVFLSGRDWRIVGGATLAALLQLVIPWMRYGTSVIRQYWDMMRHLGQFAAFLEPQPFQMHSLRSFFSLLLPWPALALVCYVLSAGGMLILAAAAWRSAAALELRYSTVLLVTILVDPHVNAYDLVVLAPAFVLISVWAIDHVGPDRSLVLWGALYLCYCLPALAAVTRITHLQASVPAIVWLAWLLGRAAHNGERSEVFSAGAER